MNNLKSKFMAFKNIFKDNNDINEKSVIGFMSFLVMIIFALVDLITGYFNTILESEPNTNLGLLFLLQY